MQRSVLSMIATFAIAGSAGAGETVSLYFDADRDFARTGQVVTWTVYASFTGFGGTAYVGGLVGNAFVDDGVARVVGYENLMAGEGTPPMMNGPRLEGINIFNAALLGTDDPSNPLAIFRVSTEVQQATLLTMDAEGIFSMFPDDGVFTLPIEYTGFEVFSDAVNLPAPGVALTFAGWLGLTTGRRRR